jgi:hypothetical protein
MNTYKRHWFPPDIIRYAVWLYYRFNLSHRDIKGLLAERGITVGYARTHRLQSMSQYLSLPNSQFKPQSVTEIVRDNAFPIGTGLCPRYYFQPIRLERHHPDSNGIDAHCSSADNP